MHNWRKFVLVLVLFTLLSPLGLTFDFDFSISSVHAVTITVNDDGGANFTSIQDAINNASSGDVIYVWEGFYSENVIINKSVSLVGNGTSNTTIIGNGSGSVVTITVDNVNLTGFTINGSGSLELDANLRLFNVKNCYLKDLNCSTNQTGIILYQADNNDIVNVSSISSAHSGIALYYSSWNTIQDCYCTGNDYAGIYLQYSNYNTVKNNTCLNSAGDGIYINNSKNNQVIDNTCLNNEYYGVELFRSDSNTVTNNLCEKSGYFGMLLSFADDNIIRRNTCNNNTRIGTYLYESYRNLIANNTCSYNPEFGIYLLASNFTTIKDNNIMFNDRYGIYLDEVVNITINNNRFEYDGLYIWGDNIYHWINHTIIGNTVNSKTLVYLKHQTGITIPASAGQIILANCTWITVENQDLSNCSVGILTGFSENSTFANNTCNDNYYGIFLSRSKNNKIINNTCKNNGNYGIRLRLSNNLSIENNTGKNNSYGVYIFICNNLNIKNNTFNSNDFDGIYTYRSNSAIITKNSCYNNNDEGIQFDRSVDYIITYNKIIGNSDMGLYLYRESGSMIVENNLIKSNQNYGLFNYRVWRAKIRHNSFINNTADGIYVYFADLVTIENNQLRNNLNGISISNSDSNKITNNTCTNNYANGINILPGSWDEVVENNTCSNNNHSGIRLESNRFRFDENGGRVIINDNTVTFNNRSGIQNVNSNNNSITNNNCSGNGQHGLEFYGDMTAPPWLASENTVTDNRCNNNFLDGFNLYNSTFNNIENNEFKKNSRFGIYLNSSMKNSVMKNDISQNLNGLVLNLTDYTKISNNEFIKNSNIALFIYNSSSNTIKNNTFSKSSMGIKLQVDSDSNIIFDNLVEFNIKTGILLLNDCNSNRIYHNNIINNTNQAQQIDSIANFWNSNDDEGNYWSDYAGVDDGSSGREAGDGIGDTLIPHLGLDSYPFTDRSGWVYPGVPDLVDPGDMDNDGSYTLTWTETRNSNGYILEESSSATFLNPNIIFKGSETMYDVIDRTDGKYYYRVKGYNYQKESSWSNIVDISVDLPPKRPEGLIVIVDPIGNALNISWNPNTDEVTEYYLFVNVGGNSEWQLLSILQYPNSSYKHTKLINGLPYYYRVQANDSLGQLSEFSITVDATPADKTAPNAPFGLRVKETFVDSISLIWNYSFDPDILGYNIYRNTSQYTNDWGEQVNGKLITKNEYTDEGLEDDTEYFYVIAAVDDGPNISPFSNKVKAKTKLGPVGPEVYQPIDMINIAEDTVDSTSIDLYRLFRDRNGDRLKFETGTPAHLDITIYQNNGTVVLIPEKDWYGSETIFFTAKDGLFSAYTEILITVTPVNDPPDTPTIIAPEDGLEVNNTTPVYFEGECSDPDLPEHDKLLFTWSSNQTGQLGVGRKLTKTILKPGYHKITLTVTDLGTLSSETSIEISITETPKPTEPEPPGEEPDDDEDEGVYEGIWFRAAVVFGIFILIIVVFLLFIMVRRRAELAEEEEDEAESVQRAKTEDKDEEEEFDVEIEEDEDFIEDLDEYFEDEELTVDSEDDELEEELEIDSEEVTADEEMDSELETDSDEEFEEEGEEE